ncbi:hypothetical protein DD606_25840 [Enterobacter cloacae complex sp. GF14B]|nr:hypothetical protein DD606_25840 [Enterobacter cloacae complex sp. GF14B]
MMLSDVRSFLQVYHLSSEYKMAPVKRTRFGGAHDRGVGMSNVNGKGKAPMDDQVLAISRAIDEEMEEHIPKHVGKIQRKPWHLNSIVY